MSRSSTSSNREAGLRTRLWIRNLAVAHAGVIDDTEKTVHELGHVPTQSRTGCRNTVFSFSGATLRGSFK